MAQLHEPAARVTQPDPLAVRKSAIVLKSGAKRPVSHISSIFALSFALRSPGRSAVRMAIYVDPARNGWVVRRSPRDSGIGTIEPERREVQLRDKRIDGAYRILPDIVSSRHSGRRSTWVRSAHSRKRLIPRPLRSVLDYRRSSRFHTASANSGSRPVS